MCHEELRNTKAEKIKIQSPSSYRSLEKCNKGKQSVMNVGPWKNGANDISVHVLVNLDSVMETQKNCAPEGFVYVH